MSKVSMTSRARRNLLIAASVLAVFTITGFFAAPPIIKSQVEKRATHALGRTVTVQKVRVNPYAVSVTLEGVDVRLKDGTGSFLGWKRLYVNLDPLASITGTLTVGAIELDGFHVTAQLKPDGTFNFADIVERLVSAAAPASPQEAPAKPARPLRVGSLKVQGARLDFLDQQPKRPFATTFGPVSFALADFVTAGAAGAPYHFEAISEAGEKFSWSGTLAADPLASQGAFEIANLVLKKYTPYLDDMIGADLTGGSLSLTGHYDAAYANGKPVLKLTGGQVHLRDLKVNERATQALAVELPVLDVTGIAADAIAQRAAVERVALAGGHLVVRRERTGAINLLTMLQPPGTASAPVATATPATKQAPEFLVGEVALQDFRIDLTDLAAPRPAQLALGGVQVTLKQVTLADGAEMPLQLAFDWAPQGTIKLNGTVALKPALKVNLATEVAGLALLPLSPYLEQFVNARVTQGAVTSRGTVQVELAGEAPAITFAGDVAVEKFGLVDAVQHEELAGFGSLALKGIKLATAPQLAASVDEVKVDAPYARVVVGADKTLNLAALARTAAGGAAPSETAAAVASGDKLAPPPAPPAPLAASPQIEIGSVVISGGDFSFSDRSITPAVRVAVTAFGGTIGGLSSSHPARADVDLRATVDGAGPIAITGKLDPFGATRFVDLGIVFKNVDLLPLSPYSGKYAGYELARGKLSLDIKARLEGSQLDATNVITLNQFTFGAPVESPDATKLPVRLGVALLKDMDGTIIIDVPMSGNIDDPSLRIGKVVLRVVVNLLTKAAVSPFALLGSMFGGGGDELAFQEFIPGESALQPVEIKKLETMTKALANRPGLTLALEGGFDGPADTYALKQRKLAVAVRAAVWAQRHAVDPNIPPPDLLSITPEENAAMLRTLFDEKFPPGTAFGAPLAQAPVVAVRPPAPRKNLFGRVMDVVTLKPLRSPAAAPAASASEAAAPVDPAADGPTLKEMSGRLAEAQSVTEDELRALAAARAQQVRDYFVTQGAVAPERLFLAQGGTPAGENKGPRVFLSLQ